MENFDLSFLTPEQQEKAKALKTKEDIMKFIEEENIDLSEEQLNAISGGGTYIDIIAQLQESTRHH